mmetsp:Transcript_26458/g.74018  ORF Transcript_26458/g.74018 Transcript_26458/m.74018 type:complete len:3261 (+) Transcript_26458:550-10332(+)
MSGGGGSNGGNDGAAAAIDATPWYPMRASLNFVPGGCRPATSRNSTASNDDDGYFLALLSASSSGGSATPGSVSPSSSPIPPPAASSMSASTSSINSATAPSTPSAAAKDGITCVDDLVHEAKVADDRLHQYAVLFAGGNPNIPTHLPSLSVLAGAAFGRLTGVPPSAAKSWADAMVLQYLDDTESRYLDSANSSSSAASAKTDTGSTMKTAVPTTEEEIWSTPPMPVKNINVTTANVLRQLLQSEESRTNSADITSPSFRPRPCGYVFKSGDIAWNCRTCQTDSTCVICDTCFRNSDHEGHEVYFHRTTPGGCCDCGDAEAWKFEGCCDAHRPQVDGAVENTNADDPEEAVRMAARGLHEEIETLSKAPTALPPKLAAALGVVIGAAVNCLMEAVDGAGIGADPSQWNMRWSDEASRIWNAAVNDQDYSNQVNVPATATAAAPSQAQSLAATASPVSTPQTSFVTPKDFVKVTENNLSNTLPKGYKLHLRLHNDDVHTFDEVIEALHRERRPRRNQVDNDDPENQSLVDFHEAAKDMTHHVDSDGQVLVKSFVSFPEAMRGFRKLKSKGLHCAVVSTSQVDIEQRARALSSWLTEISSAHPAAAVLVVHALTQASSRHTLAGISVWHQPHTIPAWAGLSEQSDELQSLRRRLNAFPPHLLSSYVTYDEAETLHRLAMNQNAQAFTELAGTDPNFYASVPYRLPSGRYHKSPHALWGTLPSLYTDQEPVTSKHPFLYRLSTGQFDPAVMMMPNKLRETVYVVDTDLRKQQEAERITKSIAPHRLPGLHLISGVGSKTVDELSQEAPPLPNPMEWRHLLATSSFRAPMSPILLLLLLDPYPTKQLRGAVHALFLSLLTDSRFKCRFAAALGISYRPLSTLYCAGVGTEADSPLGFTVQIFTAGSLVRALGSTSAIEKLLLSDNPDDEVAEASIGVYTVPIAQKVVRCIHTNLLGSTKEVQMILKNTAAGNDGDENNDNSQNDSLLPALTYVAGEHPMTTILAAAPDDGFIDSRSTRHKRLPHLLRDLEYVIETPGTAMRLLLPNRFPAHQGSLQISRAEEALTFATCWARLLRLAQGMDPQKRKISAGHVEYEQNRWLEAFGLSLNFAGTLDALAESPTNSTSATLAPVSEDGSHLVTIREAMGNVLSALLRELKLWLYREGMLETGLPVPPGGGNSAMDMSQVEALQRSTLHVSASQLAATSDPSPSNLNRGNTAVALACATKVNMTEAQLDLIESALRTEGNERQYRAASNASGTIAGPTSGAVMGDWLRVPHSPLGGDSLSFHLPLHRAIAKIVQSACSVVVPESSRENNANGWWKIPVLDGDNSGDISSYNQHPLVPLIRPILRGSNCRVVWASPDCSPQEAQRRRARSRTVSANIAVAKIIHSLADHPIRCLAAAQQIERHLWARNGSSTAGMALNYSITPLCRSFRDLDVTLIQLSAAGMSAGLGARRIFNLLISRFTLDGYLCDPERRSSTLNTRSSYTAGLGIWINPPRLQDPDHAVVLSESFFSTLCVIVTELPSPPPISTADETWLRQSIKRELIHALAAEPRSYSAAQTAASYAIDRRDESDGNVSSGGGGGMFRNVFASVLKEVGKQKGQSSSRGGSAPAAYELKPECCDEYDPTFFHLRRVEHQHAMDIVAMLRKQKLSKGKGKNGSNNGNDAQCLPLVCAPPKAHPRFLPSRLLLHLPSMDAAVRRYLLYALMAGSWLPPPEPMNKSNDGKTENDGADAAGGTDAGGVGPAMMFGRSAFASGSLPPNGFKGKGRGSSFADPDPQDEFSEKTVAASSVSFLEVLQLLTLQVHTLEECASLHIEQTDLDDEAKSLSAGLSINSYLGRLVRVPESLVDVWALRPHPDGPLTSKGSGEKRGSILGLLIALYEHRADHGAGNESGGSNDQGGDGHGGARSLAASGLKWLLRFVNALVDGAPSVAAASKSATSGVPIRPATTPYPSSPDSGMTIWTIDDTVRFTISAMLSGLPDLWPKPEEESPDKASSADVKNKERGKAAQKRMLEMMRKKQTAFVATMDPTDNPLEGKAKGDEEVDLCIICRCDDADGENNGPLGYLGHVQRSRVAQMRACNESMRTSNDGTNLHKLLNTYTVVGHMGCQLRETEAMDSNPLTCLPPGSLVRVIQSTVSDEYDILSRRVFVEHESDKTGEVTKGWASVQSSQGYVILSPLVSSCYESTRWGSTRPIIRQCGHAAHLRCVETHTLSLHQRAAGDQPYDGRFAANIDDGEFLCPLCKQLSNILIPRDGCSQKVTTATDIEMKTSSSSTLQVAKGESGGAVATDADTDQDDGKTSNHSIQKMILNATSFHRDDMQHTSEMGVRALSDFGSHLLQAMDVPWERSSSTRKSKSRRWHRAIMKWDYEEEETKSEDMEDSDTSVGNILRLLRQQHISWAAVGHSAASAEASTRGIEEVLPFGSFSKTDDPWPDYSKTKDTTPTVLELKRTVTGASGLLEVMMSQMVRQLSSSSNSPDGRTSIVGKCLADIMDGRGWVQDVSRHRKVSSDKDEKDLVLWSQLTSLMVCTPCHVARDGMIAQRREARAAAASMWVIRDKATGQTSPTEAPTPFAVQQVASKNKPLDISMPKGWGTFDPVANGINESKPFRPAVASAFLYMPLLAWDMNTLAGAIFSTILAQGSRAEVTSKDLLDVAKHLVLGRLVQCMMTPYGFDLHQDAMDVEDEDEEGHWSDGEIERQGEALLQFLKHCRSKMAAKSFDDEVDVQPLDISLSSAGLFGAVGRAILPFSRSLILILRACLAVIRERQRSTDGSPPPQSTAHDIRLDNLVEGSEALTTNDGFYVFREMGGPMPTSIADKSSFWWSLIGRWINHVIGFELHHGSDGKSLIPQIVRESAGVGAAAIKSENVAVDSQAIAPKQTEVAISSDNANKLVAGTAKQMQLADDEDEKKPAAAAATSLLPPASSSATRTEGQSNENDDMDTDDNNSSNNHANGNHHGGDDDEDDELYIVDGAGDQNDLDDDDFASVGMDSLDDEAPNFLSLDRNPRLSSDTEDSALDELSLSGSDMDDHDGSSDAAHAFARVSQCPILSQQPSLLALETMNSSRSASSSDHRQGLGSVMADLSLLGQIHRRDMPTFSLIRLPKSFVELYGVVNKVKGREEVTSSLDESEDVGNAETAICLLTGSVMRSGSSRRPPYSSRRPPGACTLHARKNGSGIGIFFLVQKCTVLLMHNNKSAYSPSIFVDEHGEEDPGLRRGRPLFLNADRYRALELLWRQQGIPREVAQIRSTSDRVIRDNWY